MAERKVYYNKLDGIAQKFRNAKVPMNRTSLQKIATSFAIDEENKAKFVEYVLKVRAGQKIEL